MESSFWMAGAAMMTREGARRAGRPSYPARMPGPVSTPPGRPRAARALAGLALAACAAACQGEPSLLCDRVRFVWPFFNLDPTMDTSPDDGLQIDLALRTSLLPGTAASLSVQGEDQEEPVPHPEQAVADDDGDLLFTDVTVPLGRIRLEVSASNECGDTRSVRTPYVWDGLGYPICDLDLGVERALVDDRLVLGAEHDADPAQAGLQLDVAVGAGRPDMTVTLFALDQATGEERVFEQESGDDRAAEFPLTLGEGPQALRAVCAWEPGELRPSSPTLELLVDTAAAGATSPAGPGAATAGVSAR
jgi:hypothetical protein